MVGAAISGLLIDRYGPRNVLLGAQFVYAPTAIAMTRTTSLWQLVAGCVVFGLSVAPIMTATSSFAPYLSDKPEEFVTLNSLLEGVGALSFVVGPAVGAVMAKTISIPSVFWLDAVMTLIGAALVWPVRTPPMARVSDVRHPLHEIADGMRTAYGIRSVRYYVLMGTVVWLSFGAFGALEPLFYRDVVGTGIETIGWVNSIFGAGIGLGALALTRLPGKVTSARGLAIGVVLVGLGAVLYVGTTDLRIIAVGAFVWGAVIGGIEPLLRTLMQLDAPDEYVGRVMGTAQLHRNAGELVPLALAPGLAACVRRAGRAHRRGRTRRGHRTRDASGGGVHRPLQNGRGGAHLGRSGASRRRADLAHHLAASRFVATRFRSSGDADRSAVHRHSMSSPSAILTPASCGCRSALETCGDSSRGHLNAWLRTGCARPRSTTCSPRLLSVEDADEAYAFLLDLCTVREIQDMAQRLAVARMLAAGEHYSAHPGGDRRLGDHDHRA